jgi:hypothetical protein
MNTKRYINRSNNGGSGFVDFCGYECEKNAIQKFRRLSKLNTIGAKETAIEESIAQCPKHGTEKCEIRMPHIRPLTETILDSMAK